MAKPISNFSFIANGLSVQFTDRSSGIINSRLWDFGFQVATVEQTSTLQNPIIVFPLAGKYTVSLASTNTDGTDTFSLDILVSVSPGLNITIRQMVMGELPSQLAFNELYFQQRLQKWQLFLQPLVKPAILDADVFDETKWKPLANTLIAKLVIYDLIQQAANSSMSSFLIAQNSLNKLAAQTTFSTIQVADYALVFSFTNPTVINMIMIDGVSFGPSSSLTTLSELLLYLNNLNHGIFSYNGSSLISLGNSHIITSFSFTQVGGTNTAFTQTNARIVTLNRQVTSGGTSGFGKGPVKHIETGPTKVEWYDASAFWTNMLKGFTTGAGSPSGGILGLLIQDICLYAKRLNIYNLELCQFKNPTRVLFITSNHC